VGTLHRVERGERWGGVLWVGRAFTMCGERGRRAVGRARIHNVWRERRELRANFGVNAGECQTYEAILAKSGVAMTG
jgi:hypothetical protein